MKENLNTLELELLAKCDTWLVTGAAGFIGSNLVEFLLGHDQKVVGIDNLSTGQLKNLEDVKNLLPNKNWDNFTFIEGDIQDYEVCSSAVKGVNRVLHQAALGSVPRSIIDPISTHSSNISGFLNIIKAAQEARVESFVYASSSSVYGDSPLLPKVENTIGAPLSPYALTKLTNEMYGEVFFRCYGFKNIGLRYFNVFGKRQDPYGAYAAVIPLWIASMLQGRDIIINGDGETSRDFCYIDNVVQANIRASLCCSEIEQAQVFNIAFGEQATLNGLFNLIQLQLATHGIKYKKDATYGPFRSGDVRHSLADISKAKSLLGYAPAWNLEAGLEKTMGWYIRALSDSR